MFAPVAAAGAGIKQRAAKAVVGGTTDHQVAGTFGVILTGGRAKLALHAGFHAESFRDGLGDKVHYATDALRPVTYGTAAADHVYRIHIAEGYRRQRQLRLAIRGKGHRNAVHQHRRTAGQAWV